MTRKVASNQFSGEIGSVQRRRIRDFLDRFLRSRGAGFGVAVLLVLLLTALTADLIAPYSPVQFQDADVLEPPSLSHLLGTDQLARDTLSRVIYGARVSVQAGVGAVGFALVVGVSIGLLAGYYGGWVDDVFMRLIDGFYAFPLLLLALAIAYSLGPGLNNTLLAIGVGFTPHFARLTRGQALSVREREFVSAARVTGAQPWRIMAYHIWPNVTAAIIVQASLLVGQAIITEAALSFLGLGVEPPTASWGSMLKVGYQYLDRSLVLSFAPGCAMFITVLGFNFLGDGLRHALDPRLWQRGVV